MAKRGSIVENMRVSKAGTPASAKAPSRTSDEGWASTSVHLPVELLELLRMAAVKRASRQGGRPNVSEIVREALEAHRKEIEGEL